MYIVIQFRFFSIPLFSNHKLNKVFSNISGLNLIIIFLIFWIIIVNERFTLTLLDAATINKQSWREIFEFFVGNSGQWHELFELKSSVNYLPTFFPNVSKIKWYHLNFIPNHSWTQIQFLNINDIKNWLFSFLIFIITYFDTEYCTCIWIFIFHFDEYYYNIFCNRNRKFLHFYQESSSLKISILSNYWDWIIWDCDVNNRWVPLWRLDAFDSRFNVSKNHERDVKRFEQWRIEKLYLSFCHKSSPLMDFLDNTLCIGQLKNSEIICLYVLFENNRACSRRNI